MRHAALKIATAPANDRDDYAAMSDALSWLYRAAASTAADAVAALSASERARLAVYCYGRAHLNTIGLAIAAQCDVDQLIAASHSPTVGRTLFEQSRDASLRIEKPAYGRRVTITLATSAS